MFGNFHTYFSGGLRNTDPAKCTGGEMAFDYTSDPDMGRFWSPRRMPKNTTHHRVIYVKNTYDRTYDLITWLSKNPADMISIGVHEPKNTLAEHRHNDTIVPEGVVFDIHRQDKPLHLGMLRPGEFRALHLRMAVPTNTDYADDWRLDMKGWWLRNIECECGKVIA